MSRGSGPVDRPADDTAVEPRRAEPALPPLDGRLVLLGGGRMGQALAAGWLRVGLPAARIALVDPDAAARNACLALGLEACVLKVAELAERAPAQVLVVAVKPQLMGVALPPCRPLVDPGTLVLSIAAGTPLATFESAFGTGTHVIRAMPNTPAAVGRGITVLCAGEAATEADRSLATALMAAVGEVAWVEDEALLHAVTALSGSGPAYVFHLIEALAEGGIACGLPPSLAARLARATIEGAGELARRSPADAAALRAEVTSPGGTTAAALAVLMAEDGLADLMRRAVTAASDRSRALAAL